MKQPLQITFHGMDPSDAVEDAVRKKAVHLERFADDIMACRVVVDLQQKHKHQGRPFGVRIDLTLRGHELVVDRVENEDVYVALRDAFDDMKRKLEDVVRQRRGDEKLHPLEMHGEVVRLNDAEGFGFIRTADGQEYYFGRDNLASGRFEQLDVGTAVQFIAEAGAQGAAGQAGERWQARRGRVVAMTKRPASPGGEAKRRRRPPATPATSAIPEAIPVDADRIIQRPDGFHWIAPDGRQEFGPFETLESAMADMVDAADENAPQPGEALQEAESEVGIAEWLDPQTGEPAEGTSPPHLDEE